MIDNNQTNPANEELVDDAIYTDMAGDLNQDEAKMLRLASRAYQDSTDYFEVGIHNDWRDSLAHFRSEHVSGSKYHTDAYKSRSKMFRPKPRAAERTLMATAATALFTNQELISVEGLDPGDEAQADAAKLMQPLVQYRLENTIPWFLTCLGAYQDTNVYGICISAQEWHYETKETVTWEMGYDENGQLVLDDDGTPMGYERRTRKIVKDAPDITLIAPENFRFDPNADWRNVVKTSPYLIEEIPMYAGEVADKCDGKTWEEMTLEQVVNRGRHSSEKTDTIRLARNGSGREDPTDIDVPHELRTVWVRRVILRDEEGEDWVFWTLGDNYFLDKPKRLLDVYPQGRELYCVGFSVIETHRTVPSSVIHLAKPLTEISNEVCNQRFDNVKLVLNKRYLLRQNAGIDIAALIRNVPGGGVTVTDVDRDIKVMETNDVTSSSYQEQDRLAVETDEILGTFSQASVQSNKALNETVGGMNLISGAANAVQELGLRTFIETWVEPVLKTLVKLIAFYETDEKILAIASSKAEIMGQLSDELFKQDLIVRVNVGMGNTNPQQKMARFLAPVTQIMQLPESELAQKIDWEEIGLELFSLSGHGDGRRFMLAEDKLAEKQQAAAENQPQDPRIVVEQMRTELRKIEIELRGKEIEQDAILRQIEIESRKEVEYAKIAAQREIKTAELYEKLGIQRETEERKAALEQERIRTTREIGALNGRLESLRIQLQNTNLQKGFDTF